MNLDLGAESDVRSTWKLSLSDLHPDDLTDERTPQGEVSYTFDGTRRRTSMTVSGQPAVSYTWDNANRLAGITQSGTLGTTSVAFGYDNSNRRTSLTLPNGIVLSYAYDNDSRVTGMSWMSALNQVGDLEYSYDADGHVIEKTGSLATTGIPSAVSGNAFNAANEMTAFNGTPLTYDLNGNLLNDGTNIYTWDAKNHLSTLAGSGTVATSASFIYDPLGRRLEKTINQQTTAFLYDGLNPVQELTPSGLGQFAPTATMLTGLGIDEFFQRSDANGAQSFIRDSLGSTLALTNAVGSTSTSYTYEPFGNVSINPSATNTNPYQFTGRENDGTRLFYYRARYYGPSYQRFIGQDPFDFFPAGPNLYGYTLDQPTGFSDPSGDRQFQPPPIEGGPGYFSPAGGEEPVSFPDPYPILPNPLPLPPGSLLPAGAPLGPPVPPYTPSWNWPPARCLLTGACKCVGAAGCIAGCGLANAGDEELGFPACETACGGAVDRSCENSFPCGGL